MFSTTLTIKTVRGNSDMIGLVNVAEKSAQPTVGDCLYAGQRQRTRILNRTARGVDVDENSFVPYSTNGPYYYYPGKNAGNRVVASARTAGKLGIKKKATKAQKRAGILGRTRLGIKFASYAAFKSALGRFGVDLRGPSAPHMLQALIVRVKNFVLADSTSPVSDSDEPANEIAIGIYGPEAERAEGHNEGTRHLPRRHFLGANESDKGEVLQDILSRAAARTRLALGGSK